MRSCHVAKCRRKMSDGVNLFTLPQNSVRSQLWLDRIKRREANRHTKIKNIRICLKHFYGGIILSINLLLFINNTFFCVLIGKPAKDIYTRGIQILCHHCC
jgi:hypothetical protein